MKRPSIADVMVDTCVFGPDFSGRLPRMNQPVEPLRGPHFVVTGEGDLHGEDTAENREVARRIHACVNACEGISTDELEKGILQDMRRVLAQLVPVPQDRVQQGRQQPAARDPRIVIRNQPMSQRPLQDA
jgi:hypothetical protein